MVLNIATLWCGQHKISLCSELLPNQELWGNALRTATKFFSKSLLPEMVGKCYTHPGCKVQAHINTPPLTCYEDKVERRHVERSISSGCDNDARQIKWYHMSCLRMKELPEGYGFCPTCHGLT